ncbi:MAG: hypothetical protein HWE34_11105 [Methylocystaceae bacterium]|nr:hypothetical protein [Methylocystaceae bacterium]
MKPAIADIKNATCPTHEKLIRLLQTGCNQFGMMLGLVSKIENETYTVICAYPDGLLNVGETFPINDTICNITQQHTTVTSFTKASGTDWMMHPAYEKFSIESYIGTIYYIDGKAAGTLNFSSPTALGRDFNNKDYKDIRQLAQTVSEILIF